MKKRIHIIFILLCAVCGREAWAQSSDPISIYEGEQVASVGFEYVNPLRDAAQMARIREEVEATFQIHPFTQFNRMQTNYYLAQVQNLPAVKSVDATVAPVPEGGVRIVVEVTLATEGIPVQKPNNIFRDIRAFPVVYSKGSTFLTTAFSTSEIVYSNDNAWFAEPGTMLEGNPLADGPAGKGYTGWLEGYAMGGIYGVTGIIPRIGLHLYGGASYLASFSAGRELFTDRSRFHGAVEDAYFGIVGGRRIDAARDYSYNIMYGRKPFTLGNGWLITNVSMNGHDRAALQLNARTAARRLFIAGFRYGGERTSVMARIFQVRPDELPIVSSRTVIDGVDVDFTLRGRLQLAASVLHVPRSDFGYYRPDGTVNRRKGLWVYNIRAFGNPAQGQPGVFFKTELGYQRNRNFDMKAFAGYVHVGYNFANTYGQPSLSYRFAYFPGDDPEKKAYGRWDPLYTGGNGEQWVQGSNMYKVVQNSNEITHMLQLVYTPVHKLQTVTQLWLFLADRKNNLGGNPALSELKSKMYGSEINLTVKYFHSRHWYFHMNSALTFPGKAITRNVPGAKTWFSLMAFARYSF